MTARKSLAYLLLGACIALSSAQVGCNILGTSDQPAQTEPTPMSIADAQKAKKDAESKLVPQERLEKANTELGEARRKASELRAKWEKLRAATLSNKKDRKDPDDPDQAPRTVTAKKEYEAADAEAQAKAREYEALSNQDRKAREDVRAAQAIIAGTATGAEGGDGGVRSGGGEKQTSSEEQQDEGMFAGVTTFIPMLLALLCLGLLGFLLLKLLRLEGSVANVRKLIHDSHGKQDAVLQKLNASASSLNEMTNGLAKLTGEVIQLRESFVTDRRDRQRQSELAAREAASATHYGAGQRDANSPYGDPVDFPISTSSFLARIPGNQQMPIKLDPLKNILVKDQEGLGLLMLVRDMSVRGGQLCMVPGMERLQTAQDYHYNYEKFYDCGSPSAGEVWIARPALVDRVDGGWKLLEKGQLELR